MKKSSARQQQEEHSLQAHAVILAGGRGTRFWPRSRLRTPKQLLNIIGRETMFEQTIARLRPLFAYPRQWVVTNAEQSREVRRIAPFLKADHILSEPVGRNTAAAIGLAAFHLARRHREAVMAVLPADHFIADPARYRSVVQAAVALAAAGPNLVTLGIPPTRPETGYGYIEREGAALVSPGGARSGGSAFAVKRFTEKPDEAIARQFLESGNFLWNAGMFFWRVSTYLDCLKRFLPATNAALEELSRDIGTPRYARALRQSYPKLENISVDYAILEPATRAENDRKVYVLPAEVGWADIGCWAAVYELGAAAKGANVSAGPLHALDATGNYIYSPKKFVAAIGVSNLIVVETADALLLCSRDRAQDVGKITKWLEEKKRRELL